MFVQYFCIWGLIAPKLQCLKTLCKFVKTFFLVFWQVMEAMVTDEFKPNSALIVLDFLIRHGIVNTENGNKQILLL